jgi:hypothetical protein
MDCSDQNSPEQALPASLNLEQVAKMKVMKAKQFTIPSKHPQHPKALLLFILKVIAMDM